MKLNILAIKRRVNYGKMNKSGFIVYILLKKSIRLRYYYVDTLLISIYKEITKRLN